MDIVNDDNAGIKDVDESVICKGISLNESKRRNVEECVDSNKSAKLVIETGIWSCNYTYCNIEDNDDMLRCRKCKKTLHYQCSKLPAYQVSLFLSQTYKKKFVCESCVEVPESLTEKCTSSISNEKQNDESDRLREEVESKCKLITSLETAQDTLGELINDKDALIESQKEILGSLHDNKIDMTESSLLKLDQALKKNELKNVMINDLQKETQSLNSDFEVLKKEYESEIQSRKNIQLRLQDHVQIVKKAELAFNAKADLVIAKNEIIDNLKNILKLRKVECQETPPPVDVDLTSPENSDTQKNLKNGVNECCEFIEIHATHGVLLNGLLLWADIQRQTTPENIWKTQAITKSVSGEITEAKEILWRISGEIILGKMVKRQGAAKSQ